MRRSSGSGLAFPSTLRMTVKSSAMDRSTSLRQATMSSCDPTTSTCSAVVDHVGSGPGSSSVGGHDEHGASVELPRAQILECAICGLQWIAHNVGTQPYLRRQREQLHRIAPREVRD